MRQGCHLYADRGAGAAACGRRGRRRCRAAGHDTQETIRTVAVSGVPTALSVGARLPERMPVVPYGRGLPSGGQLAELVPAWYGSRLRTVEHISKPLPAGTVTEPGVY